MFNNMLMKKINALQLRQSLGKIIESVEKSGEPILLERGRKPAAVIISIQDFKSRFADKDAEEVRKEVVGRIKAMELESVRTESAEDLIREIRNGSR